MKESLVGLAGVTLALILITIVLALCGKAVLATAIGAGSVAVFLVLVTLGSFFAGMWWDRESVRQGADIALRSQESDDKRDIAMIRGLTALTTAVMRQQGQQQGQLPALPLPGQSEGPWLPELAEFDVVEGEIE